jgi:hypothetical protein
MNLFDDNKPVSYKLPPASHWIWYWGGSTSNASGDILRGQEQAISAQQDMFNKALEQVAPWKQAGSAAVGQIAGLEGLPGYTALDPTKVLTSTPGYQFLQDQGTQALARYGAASGLRSSGSAMKGALNYGQNLAQTYAWGPYMSALQNLSGQGLQAGGVGAGAATSTGSGLANTYMTTANQLAQLDVQKANQQNSWLNDIMSGVGFVGSLAAAPFTGGTSLLGAGAGALGTMFSGGSGSASAFGPFTGLGTSDAYTNIYMADGGPVEAGRPYIVGERGPELIYPESNGYVVPNWALTDNTKSWQQPTHNVDYDDMAGMRRPSDLTKFYAMMDFVNKRSGANTRHGSLEY